MSLQRLIQSNRVKQLIVLSMPSSVAVVSIRGTLSLEDCVTDFMCEPVDLDEWIKEVDASQGDRSFSDRIPDVKPASAQLFSPALCLVCMLVPPKKVTNLCLEDSMQQMACIPALIRGTLATWQMACNRASEPHLQHKCCPPVAHQVVG